MVDVDMNDPRKKFVQQYEELTNIHFSEVSVARTTKTRLGIRTQKHTHIYKSTSFRNSLGQTKNAFCFFLRKSLAKKN